MRESSGQGYSGEQSSSGSASHAGYVSRVTGSVADFRFPDGDLPQINSALEVDWDGPHQLVVEVQRHMDKTTVRGVAMQETADMWALSRMPSPTVRPCCRKVMAVRLPKSPPLPR